MTGVPEFREVAWRACAPLPVDGIILAAPQGKQGLGIKMCSIRALSHTAPWMTVTGSNLEVMASDNIEMLIALGQDPLFIKETRVESIYGLVNLMDHALSMRRPYFDKYSASVWRKR